MNVVELLSDLAQRQVELWLDDGRLKFRAPRGALTAESKRTLVEHKPAIIEWLTAREALARGTHTRVAASPGEAGLLLDWRLDPASNHAHIVTRATLCPDVDPARLRAAARVVFERHPALRTRWSVAADGAVVGRIDPQSTLDLRIVDLRGRAPAEAEALIADEMDRPFDLSAGPVTRMALFVDGPGARRELVWTVHHIASDAVSQSVLQRELDAAYSAPDAGATPPATAALGPYDFTRWHADLLARSGDRLARFWRGQLAGGLPEVCWPGRTTPRPAGAPTGVTCAVDLEPALVEAARALARARRTTLAPVLLAAWSLVLARYVGSTRLPMLTPVALRDLPGFGETVGYLVNPLLIGVPLDEASTFGGLVDATTTRWQAALEHRHHPFRAVLRDVMADGGLDALHRLPEFVYVRRRQPTPTDGLYRAISHTQRGAQAALALTVLDEGGRLQARFTGHADHFEPSALTRLAEHVRTLLQSALAAPDAPLDTLEMLPPAERTRVLVEWNDTARPYPGDTPIHRLFEAVARRQPEAVALVVDDGEAAGRRLTYAALDAQSNRWARGLRALGVDRGARVVLLLDRSVELLVAMIAVLKAGGAYVPSSPADPPERLRGLLADVDPPVVVTLDAHRGSLSTGARVVTVDDDPFAGCAEAPLDVEVGPLDPAYVLFTSGSTGRPKGCVTPHRAVVRITCSPGDLALTGRDVLPTLAAVTFDAATLEIWGCLLNGGRLIVPPPDALAPAALGRLIARHDATVLVLTAAMVHLVAEALPPGLSGLRLMLSGGDVLSAVHARRLRQALPDCALINCYGPTEGTVLTTTWRVPHDIDPRRSAPIGRPLPNTRVYILDAAGRPAPIGVPGELCIAGDGLATGYLDRPALTAERFPAAPPGLGEPGRIYHTGDRARWLPSGEIEFLGRLDAQVKVRGFRVEPGEIEAALRRHPAVADCGVVAPVAADGERRLVACVTGAGEAGDDWPATARALMQHLGQILPAHMLPGRLLPIDALPINAIGKLDRAALTAWAAAERGHDPAGAAPQTPTEALLAEIWRAVLDQPVGRDTHFFRAGGHSLLAARALARVQARAAVELPLRAAFDHPTLAGLAAVIDRAAPAVDGPAPIPRVDRDGALPMLPTQRRLWFLDRLGLPAGVYTIPLLLRLRGPLDAARLAAALSALVERHESLRTVFPAIDGRPAPRILTPAAAAFALETAEADADALFAAALARDFDLAAGPLFRATLAPRGADEHLLLLAWHHIIADGLSVERLVAELGALYGGEALAAPVQCVDYAAWKAARLDPAALDAQLDGWQAALAGAPTVHALPTDHPRPPVQRFVGAHHLFALPTTLVEPLRALAAAHDATLYMTLLAAFEALLCRLGAGDDLVIGTPVAGRLHPDAASTVGLLVDMLPLRCRVDADAPFTALLAATRETLLDAHRRQDAPFERIVDRLRPQRDPAHTPLFQIVFDVPHDPTVTLPGLEAEVVRDLEAPIAKFDLTLSLMPGPDRFEGRIEYATDLFDRATIAALADRLVVLLEGIVAAPEQPVGALPVMSADEQRRVLIEWNATDSGYDRAATVPGLFAAQVAARPDAVALVLDDGASVETLTYAGLDARARSIAAALARAGVGRGDRVGLCVERGADAIAGMLGALMRGAAYVPLDPRHPPARLGFVLDDTRPAAVLVGPGCAGCMPSGPWVKLAFDGIRDGIADAMHVIVDAIDAIDAIDATDAAYVLYTSGSTGRPKGVEVSQRNITRLVSRPDFATFGPEDTVLQGAPLGFDAATLEVWGPLLNGGRLVVPGPGPLALDRIAGLVGRHGITTLWLTTGLFQVMVDDHLDALRPLRRLLTGGDVLSPAHVRRAVAALPGCRITNAYGPTENTTFTTCQPIDGDTPLEPSVPIGRPIADTRVYVLDAAQQPAPIGVPGELYAGGDGVARGYLNRPDLTAERFVTLDLPMVGPTRLYRTGDRVRWRGDGALAFLGRLDAQVKIRGFRIEPGEIEAALGRHPAVGAARVVPRPGPDGRRLVAYVVPANAPIDALRRHLRELLPAHMLPAAWVALDALPLTAHGKLDRAALPEPDAAPAVAEAPRTDLEARIAAIWQAVLGLPAVDTGRSFFDVGGSSLTLLQVHSRLQAALDRTLPVTDLFRHPTIRGLAAALDAPDAVDGNRGAEERAARRRARLGRARLGSS